MRISAHSDNRTAYVPLWCKTGYSFLEGASHPEELVKQCSEYGLSAMAVTDCDGVYGIVRAHVEAKQLGLHLIVGSQITVTDGSIVLLLCRNRQGYGNLCRLVTAGRLRSPKGECRVSWREIFSYAEGLIAIWGIGGLPAKNIRSALGFRPNP